jgi:hypothetical protein
LKGDQQMDINPGPTPNFPASPAPPAPPSRRSLTRLWIGISAGVILLCLCGLLAGVEVWTNRLKVPGLANLFATPTPQGLKYSNASMDISLYYPIDWVYNEQSKGVVLFASSQAVLASPDVSLDGAAMGFIVSTIADLNLPASVDSTSPESILSSFVQTSVAGATSKVMEAVRPVKLGTHSAASTVILVDTGTSPVQATYLTMILRNADVVLAIGFTSESQLAKYRPVFDRILSTADLGK